MATINVGGILFEYEPGSTYLQFTPRVEGEPEPPAEEKEQSRADARAEAIKRFQTIASNQTLEAIAQTVQILFAQLIQFRALNGTLSQGGQRLPAQLREAADYLEDL
jgi:hypothetical protein